MIWIHDAIVAQLQTENRVLRILGSSAMDPGLTIEEVLDETPLRQAI